MFIKLDKQLVAKILSRISVKIVSRETFLSYGGLFEVFLEKHFSMYQFFTTKKQKTGLLGESLAAEYIEENNYKIVGRNYKKPWGEIDIVAQKGRKTIFIEVKTMSIAPRFVDYLKPEDQMTQKKKNSLKKVILSYLKEKKIENQDWQIDIVAVELMPGIQKVQVRHLKNIIFD